MAVNWKLAIAALLAFGSAATVPARAQDDPLAALRAALPGHLINDPTSLDWTTYGKDLAVKPVKGVDALGGGALQFTVPKAGATMFTSGASLPLTVAVKPGQRLVVAFWARTISAGTPDGQGQVNVKFQQNVAPFAGFGDKMLSIGKEWKLYEVTAVADKPLAKGQGTVVFHLAAAKQVIQFGQTIVVEGAATVLSKTGAAPVRTPTPVMLPKLVGKGDLINDPGSLDWNVYGTGTTHSVVAARGMPGDEALQVVVSSVAPQIYNSGIVVPVNGPIKTGDILLIAVLARTIAADTPDGLGRITLRVQETGGTFAGFGDYAIPVAPTWKLFQIKTSATVDIAPGKASVALLIGGAKQTLEIGRVYVMKNPTP